jgi:hypothetical protein
VLKKKMHFALKTPIAIEQKTEGNLRRLPLADVLGSYIDLIKNSRFRVFEKKIHMKEP